MFENPGKKIKVVAQIFFWCISIIGSIALIISFAVSEYDTNTNFVLSFLTIVITILLIWLFSWISSLLLYGFGELIENTTDTADYTYTIAKPFCKKKQEYEEP